MGLPVEDVDIATTLLPERVIRLVTSACMKAVPTGFDHGTVTVIVGSRHFEVTTLRQDVKTDGRHACVEFTDDLTKDAQRRDFTINALYLSKEGELIDLISGVKHCQERKIRFIGVPEKRIQEDYLRILRFFRFSAVYGGGVLDPGGLRACASLKDELSRLAPERIANELKKILSAGADSLSVLGVMRELGILEKLLAEDITLDVLTRLHVVIDVNDLRHESREMLLLAALADDIGRVENISSRLRLSKKDTSLLRDTLVASNAVLSGITSSMSGEISESSSQATQATMQEAISKAASHANDMSGETQLTESNDKNGLEAFLSDRGKMRLLKYRFTANAAENGLLLAAAKKKYYQDLRSCLSWMSSSVAPDFPLRGSDLLALGFCPGPMVGMALEEAEKYWVSTDFQATKSDILQHISYNLVRHEE